MGKDTKYLKFNGHSWVFQKRISEEVKTLLNIKSNVYQKGLGTDSLKEARALRHQQLVYLQKLEEAEKSNPSYADVLDAYKYMDEEELEYRHVHLNEDLSYQYQHLGHPEWEAMSKEKKIASGLPLDVTPKDDIEYRILSSLLNKDPNFKPPEQYRLKLKEALDKYLEELEGEITKKAIGKYKNSVAQFLNFVGQDDYGVWKVDRITIRDFITSSKKIYARATISNTLSCLSGIWKYVRDAENINTANPFEGHRIAKKRSKVKKYYKNWDVEDLRKVVDALAEEKQGAYDQLPVYIAWYTGSRLNEAYGVKPKDIKKDKDTGIPYISFKEDYEGKTEATTRNCPIHPELEKKLENFTGFLRTSPDAYGKIFGKVKKKLGFTDRNLSFHSIRGNTSTALDKLQALPHIASQIVGHKDKGGSFTYTYYSEGAGLKVLKEWVDKLPTL